MITVVEPSPPGDPSGLPNQVLFVLWDADGNDVGLELDGLVEPQKGQVILEAGRKSDSFIPQNISQTYTKLGPLDEEPNVDFLYFLGLESFIQIRRRYLIVFITKMYSELQSEHEIMLSF